jgi:Zn-dependent protease
LLTSLTQGWAIGWASAPYDPIWAARYPKRAAIMAAAGPAGNLLIALAALALMKMGLAIGVFTAPASANFETVVAWSTGAPTFATTLLSVLLVQNTFLCLFNLLPLPPLDGSAVLVAFLPERQAVAMRQSSHMMSMIGLVVAWRVFPLMTGPLFSLLLRVVHPGESYS